MKNYPFYLKFIRTIQFQFSLLSKITSIINAPHEEICAKNKVLAIKMLLKNLERNLLEVEQQVLSEEFAFSRFEVEQAQERMTALSMRFIINLN